MDEPRRPRLLNSAVVHTIVEKHAFRKPPLGCGDGVKTSMERLKEKYQVMLLDFQWSRSFDELLHSLKHVTIGSGFETFHISAVEDNIFTEKKLEVDSGLLEYLFNELGVRFESLRISTTHVETVDGKQLSATAIAVNAKIEGLSTLVFDSYPTTEEEIEQLFADAETIVQHNGATLRKLKCAGNGARYAKMLPPTATLESLDVRLDSYRCGVGYTLEEIATVLRANATAIRIEVDTHCEGFEYTAGGATACRKLKLVRSRAQEGSTDELEAMLKCVAAVGTHLESVEIVLDGYSAKEGEVDFFAFVDERATQFATTIQSVAFVCPTTVRANFYINYYFDPQVAIDFVERFRIAYPNVTAGAEEELVEEAIMWSLDRSVDLGEGRTLRVDVSVEPLDEDEVKLLLLDTFEINLGYNLEDEDTDGDANEEWGDAYGLELDDDEY